MSTVPVELFSLQRALGDTNFPRWMEVLNHMVENWVGSVSDSPLCAFNLGDMVLY